MADEIQNGGRRCNGLGGILFCISFFVVLLEVLSILMLKRKINDVYLSVVF